jgi:hypothetical protein
MSLFFIWTHNILPDLGGEKTIREYQAGGSVLCPFGLPVHVLSLANSFARLTP